MLVSGKSVTAAFLLFNLITLSTSSNQSTDTSDDISSKSGTQPFEKVGKRQPIAEPKGNLTAGNGKLVESKNITVGTQKVNDSSVIERKTVSNGNATVENGDLVERKRIINNTQEVNDTRAVEHGKGDIIESKAILNGSQETNESKAVENKAEPKRNVAVVTGNVIEPKLAMNGTITEKSKIDSKGDKELHKEQKREGVSAIKENEELSTHVSNKHITNQTDEKSEMRSKSLEDKELTLRAFPILPPLPIMFRAFVPLVIPPLENIAVNPVPPPALHISDRLPIYDADTSEEPSAAEANMDSPQRIQNAMKSLISDVLGSIRLPSPLHLNSSDAGGNLSGLVDAESGEDSKLVDLQGQPFLMKSKMTHLTGRNGRFFLRFMSLRPLESDVLSEIGEPQNINEKHEEAFGPHATDRIQKKNIGQNFETVSKENISFDNKYETGTEKTVVSGAEKSNAQARKELIRSSGDLKNMTIGSSDAILKTNSSSISHGSYSAESEDDFKLTGKNSMQKAKSDSKNLTDDQLHAEESQFKLIQNYRSFHDPNIPIYNEENLKNGSSEVRLKDIPLEGDISVAPFIAKSLPSVANTSPLVVNVKEASPSVEKVTSMAANVTEMTPLVSDVERMLQSDARVKKVVSPIGNVEKVSRTEKVSATVANFEEVPSSNSSVEKVSTSIASVEKVPLKGSNVTKGSSMSVKGDDQPYEEKGKPIIGETHSSFSNSSKKSNVADGKVDVDTKDHNVSAADSELNTGEYVSKHIEFKSAVTKGQTVNNSNEGSIKESGQKHHLINSGEKILEVGFKGTVDKLDKRNNLSQGNDTENIKLMAASALKGDILLEKK